MVWGSELHPRKVSVLCLLSRGDLGHKDGSGEEPMMTKDVEDIEHSKFDILRMRPLRLRPSLQVLGGVMSHGGTLVGGKGCALRRTW